MKRFVLIAGACALFAAPVFAQSPSEQTASPPNETAAPPVAAQAPQAPPQDASAQQAPSTENFVTKVAISDMFEIESSKLALQKRASGGDKRFAKRMIHDHGQTTAQLKRLVKSGRVDADLPKQLDSEHQQMLDQLRNQSGENFQKDYDQMQLKGHQEAVSLFENYAQNGDNPALRRWAAKTLPHLKQHLSMAEKLNGGNTSSAE